MTDPIQEAMGQLMRQVAVRREQVLAIPLPDGWCWEETVSQWSAGRTQLRSDDTIQIGPTVTWRAVRNTLPGEPGAVRYFRPDHG